MSRRALGIAGEQIAVAYLQSHSYSIYGTNIRTPFGEVDVLARAPDGTIAFIEVRTRETPTFGSPAESIRPRKLQHMIRTAQSIQQRRFPNQRFRLDLVSVQAGKVAGHIQNIEIA